jgi:hypothetical protein
MNSALPVLAASCKRLNVALLLVTVSVMMSLSFLFAGRRVVAVRRTDPPECQAARRPHVPGRCLVELVRADPTKEAAAP